MSLLLISVFFPVARGEGEKMCDEEMCDDDDGDDFNDEVNNGMWKMEKSVMRCLWKLGMDEMMMAMAASRWHQARMRVHTPREI